MKRGSKWSVATVLAAGAMVLSGCSVYDLPLPGGADVGDNPIKVTVKFRDVLDLVPQSTVKVNDVTVGKVTKVQLKGYTAEVTVALPKNIDLPDNARAEIRQTSLLGEKFVSLAAPAQPSADRLGNGDVIGLENSGRNPEVEEVLSALGALLSGGGVGQLKLIAAELNTALGGREDDVRAVVDQIRYFTGQLAANKSAIVGTIENLNRLSLQLRRQDGTIKRALDDIPAALASVDRQRADLVRLLAGLDRLSNVGVKVIRAAKESTINSLRDLAPVLNAFAAAGEDLPKSLQVLLTYPFVDEAVGRDPQVARNLHMGDYTNLSIRLNMDLTKGLGGVGGGAVEQVLLDACKKAGPLSDACKQLASLDLNKLCQALPGNPLCVKEPLPKLPSLNLNTKQGGLLGGVLGLGRAGLGEGFTRPDAGTSLQPSAGDGGVGLGTLLLQGLLESGATK